MAGKPGRPSFKRLVKDDDGAVLVMVLIVLVATIIMAVIMMRTSTLESRVAGNERRYVLDFASLESAVNLAMVQTTTALTAVMDVQGATYTYPEGAVPEGVRVTLTLEREGKPPVGSKIDPSFRARYYIIDATDENTGQEIQAGVYKVFPKAPEE